MEIFKRRADHFKQYMQNHKTCRLAETGATLTPGPYIPIPYNPLLFSKIVYNQPTIIDFMNRAERYQNTLRGNSSVNTQVALARKLGISKARLTQNKIQGMDGICHYTEKIVVLTCLPYLI